MDEDEAHMGAALALARAGLGSTWPNPAVGCVLVRGGRVVARGLTAPGGRPHAERVALDRAGAAAAGATAYVTLEPCAHTGRTPPCADALIAAGVARVVVGCPDPYPAVDGAGIARLRAAGIDVRTFCRRAEAEAVHAGFLHRLRTGRPLVTLKLATTLDGRIATGAGESRWITGPAARRAAHAMRARHDATAVGAGTIMADDPDLTCRLAGARRTPDLRIGFDTALRTPPGARLAAGARAVPTWLLHAEGADPVRAAALAACGVRLLEVPASAAGLDLPAALAALGAAGLTLLLVEGGAGLAGSLLAADLVDRLAWFSAPSLVGDHGHPAARLDVAQLSAAPRFRRVDTQALGPDLLSLYERA